MSNKSMSKKELAKAFEAFKKSAAYRPAKTGAIIRGVGDHINKINKQKVLHL